LVRDTRGREERDGSIRQLYDASQQGLCGDTELGTQIEQAYKREILRSVAWKRAGRHEQFRGRDVAQELELPRIMSIATMAGVAVSDTIAVVGEQKVPEFVRDGEPDTRGSAVRVELDLCEAASEWDKPRVLQLLASNYAYPLPLGELERIVWRTGTALLHGVESHVPCASLDERYGIPFLGIGHERHHRRVRPVDMRGHGCSIAPRSAGREIGSLQDGDWPGVPA
jgi:hypothetical protein